jgi:hypothetical protein
MSSVLAIPQFMNSWTTTFRCRSLRGPAWGRSNPVLGYTNSLVFVQSLRAPGLLLNLSKDQVSELTKYWIASALKQGLAKTNPTKPSVLNQFKSVFL